VQSVQSPERHSYQFFVRPWNRAFCLTTTRRGCDLSVALPCLERVVNGEISPEAVLPYAVQLLDIPHAPKHDWEGIGHFAGYNVVL
jgi:hypothetical protein